MTRGEFGVRTERSVGRRCQKAAGAREPFFMNARQTHSSSPAARCRRGAGGREAAFTLIEMMLAVAILIIITVTVYQFVDVTLRAADASLQAGEQGMQDGGLRRLLQAQLSSLPLGQNGSLIGMNIKKQGSGRRDAMQMVCPAGNALLTPDAKGFLPGHARPARGPARQRALCPGHGTPALDRR